MLKQFYVYLMASKKNGTLYIGVSNDLKRRVYEHKNGLNKGFTKEHQIHRLVYYECIDDAQQAILREKRLKKWNRGWKINLIEKETPNWDDLYDML